MRINEGTLDSDFGKLLKKDLVHCDDRTTATTCSLMIRQQVGARHPIQ